MRSGIITTLATTLMLLSPFHLASSSIDDDEDEVVVINSDDEFHINVVRIVVDDVGGICSGSLIAQNLVLTAAHCVPE